MEVKKEKIHFIGIGGVSQSKLALMLKSFDYEVSGSDRDENNETRFLRAQGITVFIGHAAENVGEASTVVYNGAISDENAELKAAHERGLRLVKRSECLAEIAAMHKECVAVCGCHGKTTTTAVLAFALASLKPQMHIGGNLIGVPFEVTKNKNLFVTEACEFQKNFLDIVPNYTVMLNIDADHLDCYKDIDDIEVTFLKFALKTKDTLIYNCEDPRVRRVAERVKSFTGARDDKFNKIKLVSFGKCGQVQARSVKLNKNGIVFRLFNNGKFVCRVQARLFGRHNVLNMLASCATAIMLGADDFCNMKNFAGVQRRMQFIGKIRENIVIHDYAHHPSEIAATIKAVHKHFKKPVIAVFEPHTYSRTKMLWTEFTQCFAGARRVFMLPIYSARERQLTGITSSALAAATKNCTFVRGKEALLVHLEKYNKHIILVMGAGSIEKLAHNLI